MTVRGGAGRTSMAEHKFKIGERVYFHSRSEREAPSGPSQIIRRLPALEGGISVPD
jgi:hypothetical protein